MVFAAISDVHANLEALEQVFADIDRQGIKDVFCLGDIVGYGPTPLACVDKIFERCRVIVRGNHDEALLSGAYGFHGRAREAIDWTREQLKPGFFSGINVRTRWERMTQLPLIHQEGDFTFVHGSPRDPTTEYVIPQ
jgi:predicted phosphodiesterase